jgi:hypothetical protein
MLDTPFRYEAELSPEDYQKIGQLSLKWSQTEHVIGNCLKVMLRLTDEEAIAMVFPLSLDMRLARIEALSEINPLNADARAAFDELKLVMKGIQYVRNSVAHAVVIEDTKEGHVFHLRSKDRTLTKAEIFSIEELTNYAAHAVLSLRYALGFKGVEGSRHTLPERPEIPPFLRTVIQVQKVR